MTAERRLDRLYPALSAKERAVLALQAYREEREPDPLIFSTMPWNQSAEFNRLVRLMNAVNVELATVVLILREQVRQLDLRFAWLQTLQLWGAETGALGYFIHWHTKEPITESGLKAREQELRAERLTVAQAAELLLEQYDGWADDDYEDRESETIVAEAWERLLPQKKSAVRDAIVSGALPAKGRGTRQTVSSGDLHDWIGAPITVFPDWGSEYEVRPDSDAPEVERLLEERQRARRLVQRSLHECDLPFDLDAPLSTEPSREKFPQELARILTVTIRDGLLTRWRELRAVEIAIEDVAGEFGEDPLRSDTRALIAGAKNMVTTLRAELRLFAGPVELVEPTEDDAALARALVEKAARA